MELHNLPTEFRLTISDEDLRQLVSTGRLEQTLLQRPGAAPLRVTLERPAPSNPRDDRGTDAWFRDAIRKAGEDDRRRHVSAEQMSAQNEPNTDI